MRGHRLAIVSMFGLLVACSNTDTNLNERVRTKIAQEPTSNPVAVSTQDRIVTLGGVVDNPAERDRIEMAVRRVDGVLGVSNQLVVKSSVQTTGAGVDRDKPMNEVTPPPIPPPMTRERPMP